MAKTFAQLDYIVPMGRGPYRVTSWALIYDTDGKPVGRIKAYDPKTNDEVIYKETDNRWRPLMSPMEARQVKIMLGGDDGDIEVPRWSGAAALKKIETAATRTVNVKDQVLAYLSTRPPGRKKSGSPKIEGYRNNIRINLLSEAKLVLDEEERLLREMMSFYAGQPKANPRETTSADIDSLLAQVADLAKKARTARVQKSQRAYLMNHSRRLALLHQLG